MNKRFHFSLRALVIALLVPPSAIAQTAPDAATRFKALYTREWTWRQAQSAGLDDDADPKAGRDRFPRVDAATQSDRLNYWTDILRDLETIPAGFLSAEDQVNYAIYRAQVESLQANARFRDYEKPFNSDSSFWAEVTGSRNRPMRTAADYRSYVSLMKDIPRYFEEQVVNMRAGLARGFSVPRVTLTGRDGSIAAVADIKDAEANPFYAPFNKMPTSMGAGEQVELRAAAVTAIRDSVQPAYARLLAFMRDEYMKKARVPLDAESYPDGKAYYQSKIREFTTLDLTPGRDPPNRSFGGGEDSRTDGGDHQEDGLQGRFPIVPEVPAHRSAVLREVEGRTSDARGLDREAGRRESRRVLRPPAARPIHHHPGA